MNIISLEGEKLRDYQLCCLTIADDLINVCKKYKLEYSLSGGSILGAVRHNGFIPWDDDIDINISRKSYMKLIEVFEKELGDKYYLQTPLSHPELGLMVTQLRKKGTVARRKYDWNINPCGVSIDLYIIENTYNNSLKRALQKWMSLICSFAISAIRDNNNSSLPPEVEQLENRSQNYHYSKKILSKILNIIPLKKWITICDYVNGMCHDERSRLVAIPTGRKHFSGEIYQRADMCKFKQHDFEGRQYNIPVSAEKYLQYFYGDYMKIPDVNHQERHVFLELDIDSWLEEIQSLDTSIK